MKKLIVMYCNLFEIYKDKSADKEFFNEWKRSLNDSSADSPLE